jgi:hypothetical protein
LKPFIMAYERPTPSRPSYNPSSSGGTRFKLSNLTSKSSQTTNVALATTDVEDDGTVRENRFPNPNLGRPENGGRKRSALRLGRLRPEQTGYEATASATGARGQEGSERGSNDSEQMIIKKGVEWSVKYDNDERIARERGNSLAGTEESRGATPGPDEIMAIMTHI